MKVTYAPTVDIDDICAEMGMDMGDFNFVQYAENCTYEVFNTDESAIVELKQSIATWEPINSRKTQRLKNDLELLHKFRALGCTDYVLIYVCW